MSARAAPDRAARSRPQTGSAAGRRAGVFTVPAGMPFVDALVAGILDRVAGDPLALSRCMLLLPTRRACRSLRDAFLRRAGGRPMLLPRMSPIGDIDPDALGLELEDLPALAEAFDLPPTVSGQRRQLLLARLILERGDLPMAPDQAAWLAGDLARLIDQAATENLSFDQLEKLVPAELAEHWQRTLTFLKIVTEFWPKILEGQEGAIDAADRRNRVLAAQADSWRRRPPPDPVIAAGSTGSIPATAELLKVVAGLPQGAVVLPGLDRDIDEESWQALEESHPQSGMKRLLERIGLDRAAVPDWPAPLPPPTPDRRRLAREVMRPAATTDAWRAAGDGPGAGGLAVDALDGLIRVDCPTPQEEAGVIALMMRAVLETPGRTAALVTADRGLARRVAMALRRWDIAVDDSGGRPLADTAVGSYLRLVAECALERAAPLALLALLKHPLAAGGEATAVFRYRVRQVERAVLRGPRPAEGFAGLRAALEKAEAERFGQERTAEAARAALLGWVARLEALAAPFFGLMAGPAVPPGTLLRAHVWFAEELAASDAEPGPARLWRRDDGEAAARFVNTLLTAAADFPPINPAHYPGLIEALLQGSVVRPRYGEHPRLAIWGPLEARMQQPDLMILGGLNEGTWPREPPVDPWMSRPMRQAFGLPPERRIGLSAHDFAQALAAPRVVLTRSERVEGTPTVPSRWLLRLEAVLEGAGLTLERRPGRDAGGLPLDGLRPDGHGPQPGPSSPLAGEGVAPSLAFGGRGLGWGPAAWQPERAQDDDQPNPDSPTDIPPATWLAWQRALDAPEAVRPIAPPAPRPPVPARPRALSVTEIGTWMADPYAIYARHVLKLDPLDPLEADPGAADRGKFIHKALSGFVAACCGAVLPEDALDRLLGHGRDAFREFEAFPGLVAFWWPRFERIAAWFVETEAARRAEHLPCALEVSGRITLPGLAGPFELTARADRIDRRGDGMLAVIDYKTGTVPSAAEITLGFAPQLPLEAAIASAGGFRGIDAAEICEMAHWRLSGGNPPGEIRRVKADDLGELIAAAWEGLAALIARFDDEGTPYLSQPRPGNAPRYGAYGHLARVPEWSASGGETGL